MSETETKTFKELSEPQPPVSAPELVAPVRKWEAEEVVGERRCANPDCDTTLHVFMHNLSPEVQAALKGRKA